MVSKKDYSPRPDWTITSLAPTFKAINEANTFLSAAATTIPRAYTSLDWPDRTDFSAVRSQSKRPDRETVSIFDPDRTETFIAQAFINKLG